jgi:cytochrome c-type biogenesis protein CcmF
MSGLIALIAYASAISYGQKIYAKRGNFILIAQLIFNSLAAIILFAACISNYFKMEYVAKYTDISLPLIYKFSAFWAGQEGSLFLWAWLLTIFAGFEVYRLRDSDYRYTSVVFISLLFVELFFLFLTTFVMNPFKELDFFPTDGLGMNPLLQNPGMIYHPPTLYIGFVGFAIPFAHSIASFITKDTKAFWIKSTRNITTFVWVMLTIGIVLGGQWAYVELGWGGYWAWDPVENSSLFPWLTGTAFLHASYANRKKGLLNNWSYMLVLLTFELSIFGTFLTRSGIIDSVHSFGKSPLGSFFLWFMIISTFIYLYIFFTKRKKEELEDLNFFTKEGAIYIANWIFVGLMIVVLVGSILPIFTQFFSSEKTTVNINYYNKVSIPFFTVLFFLLGFCNILNFKRTLIKKYIPQLLVTLVLAIIISLILYLKGFNKNISFVLYLVLFFALFSIIYSLIKSFTKIGYRDLLNRRDFYASMIIHIGVIIMGLGVVFSSFYKRQAEAVVNQEQRIQFDKYILDVGSIKFEEFVNYVSVYVPIKVYDKDKYVVTLKPERRFYRNKEESYGEVAIYSRISHDLYVILASYSKPENYIGLQIIIQPFISLLWIGFIIMVIGGFIIFLPINAHGTKHIKD